MSATDIAVDLLEAGVNGLVEYLSAHVLLCLVPAFFIAGALSALFKKEAVTKYLGPDTPRYISYPVASAAGLLIAVCSCTILPLFAGIWKKGAGLGPAVTFLFTGPAINVLAILYTGSLIGWDIAAARGVLSIIFGIAIGLIMGLIFERAKPKVKAALAEKPSVVKGAPRDGHVDREDEPVTMLSRLQKAHVLILFILLMVILLVGASPLAMELRLPIVLSFTVFAVIWAFKMNSRQENEEWARETYFFVKMILPLLLTGVFIAGVASEIIPADVVGEYLGGNSVRANTLAVGFGIFMYFPTLVEVPIARMFLDLGMGKGPLLAYLLSDPELSFQSVLVTRKILGAKKVAVYVALVAVFCIAAGLIFGAVGG